jgi:acyl-coenzyme A synthetase/AMP-(fatty) acid ligase
MIKNFKTSLQNTIHYEDLLADQSEYFEWPTLNENDACGMCYTSGTTGLPKRYYILTGLRICMLPPLCHPMQEIIVI